MKLVSRFEAAALGTAELFALRKDAFTALAATARGSRERRDLLASMQTIEAELATRSPRP